MAGAVEGDTFIGKKAQELRGLLRIKLVLISILLHIFTLLNGLIFDLISYPMTHGIVTDWDDMERIWSHVYSEDLRTLSEEVCFVVFFLLFLLLKDTNLSSSTRVSHDYSILYY